MEMSTEMSSRPMAANLRSSDVRSGASEKRISTAVVASTTDMGPPSLVRGASTLRSQSST